MDIVSVFIISEKIEMVTKGCLTRFFSHDSDLTTSIVHLCVQSLINQSLISHLHYEC